MITENYLTFWLVLGFILIVLETILPGGIVIFLGLSALIVATGIHFEFISTIYQMLICFFISSIIMMLFLRSIFMKYFEGDSSVDDISEENEVQDTVVLVIEQISPNTPGRINYRGTTWQASSNFELEVNSKAKIIKQEGNDFIVEPLSKEDN